jgi:multidrug efflux pump subunit AcrB
MDEAYATASNLAAQIRNLNGVSDVLIPQDLDYPGLELDVNREMAGRLGLDSSEIVDNVITALTSNGMIAPSYYVDPKNGNNYLLTVQFPMADIKSMTDFAQIPVRASQRRRWPPTWARSRSMRSRSTRQPRWTTTRLRTRDRRVCFAVRARPGRPGQRRVDRVIAGAKIPGETCGSRCAARWKE